METADIIFIARETIWTILKVSTPIMLTGMTIGLIVALFQALTQIQEMTLTFVPKIIGIFFALLIFSSYIGNHFQELSTHIFDRIASLSE